MVDLLRNYYLKIKTMSKRLFALLTSGALFFSFSAIAIPEANAEETFSTTVKINTYKELLNGRVTLEGSGSGTLISSSGLVLTNAHVIMSPTFNKPADAISICVSETPQNPPECRFTADILRYDEKIDLALLKINDDVAWGQKPSNFPHLDYDNGNEPQEGDKVTVIGFPGSGGITINSTQGQISGFEQWNGYTYLKTDADIDAGNSGGTMLNEEGEFIGIPTYIVSDFENIGRALQVSDVKGWIESEAGVEPSPNAAATTTLLEMEKGVYEANTKKTHTYGHYPELSMKLTENWLFSQIEEESFYLEKQNNGWSYIAGEMGYEFFENNNTAEENLTFLRELYGEGAYEHEEILTINGKEVVHLWNNGLGDSYHTLLFTHGYAYLIVDYMIASDDPEAEAEVDEFINSLEFGAEVITEPSAMTKISDPSYPFTFEAPKDWRIEKENGEDGYLIYGESSGPNYESVNVSYGELPIGSIHFTPEEGLENNMYYLHPSEWVTFASSELIVDGLPGWIYFSDYQADDGTIYQTASATIQDPEYEIYVYYETDASEEETNWEDFAFFLEHFKSKRYVEQTKEPAPYWKTAFSSAVQGAYNIPLPSEEPDLIIDTEEVTMPTIELTDISGHRFEENIRHLVELGVLHGNPDKTFDPEGKVNRAATLKMIFASLNAVKQNSGQETYVVPNDFSIFPDVTPDLWYYPFVAEAYEKEVVEGYPDGTFKGEQPVILAEAIKMALEAHKEAANINVWEGETDPWYKKYFDTAYQLYLLPQGLEDPSKELTRAELAYIIDQLVYYWPVE